MVEREVLKKRSDGLRVTEQSIKVKKVTLTGGW